MKRLPLAIVLLLLSLASPVWGTERIARLSIVTPHPKLEEQIRRLLPFQEGSPFDAKKLEQTLSDLRTWGRFSQVEVQKKKRSDGWELTFLLTEGIPIGEIHISGNYPYLSRRLRRRIGMRSGEPYNPLVASQQIRRLEDFYLREGYFGAKVSLEEHLNLKRNSMNLHYRIDRGHLYRMGEIKINGNHFFPRGRFVSALNPLKPFQPSRAKKSIEKIRSDYHKRGFLQARVRLTEIVPDHAEKKVHLILEVREGTRSTIRFAGNHRIATKSLKKIIPTLTEGDTSALGIEESVETVKDYYHKRGFQKVLVQGEKRILTPQRQEILFTVQEGIETRVKEIEIDGNQSVSDRKLKKKMATEEESLFRRGPYQPELVLEDQKKLPEIYSQFGFYETEVLGQETQFSPLKDKALVSFHIEENAPLRVKSVTLTHEGSLPNRRLMRLIKIKSEQPLILEKLHEGQKALLDYCHDHGHPYAEVQVKILREGQEAAVTYQLQEGERVKVGEILLLGNQRTRSSAIEKALDLKRGADFSRKKLHQSESSLRKLGIFRSVEIEPLGLKEKRGVVPLLVRLEENPAFLIDLESSYDTDDRFTGGTVLQYTNLFGYAKRSSLRLVGGQDVQKGELNFTDPRFFGRNLEMTTGGLFAAEQRPGFSAVDAGGQISLLRELTARATVLSKYKLTRTFFQDVLDPSELSERDHTTSRVGLSFNYDGRDSFADPRNGYITTIGFDLSNKIIASGFNFIQPSASFATYYSPHSRITFLNHWRAEGIKVFGTETLTRDHRLFLGGDYTLRGFNQDGVGPIDSKGDPAGGQLLFAHTFETQIRIKGEFQIAGFLDSGTLTNNFSAIGLDSLRHSAGPGLRYVTPIGALRLDYGIKLDQQPGESESRLHFAFGYAF